MSNISTFRIIDWKKLEKKNQIKINLKNIKKESLICNLPNRILIKYLNGIEKNNGRVIICHKKNDIIGLLVFEKNPNNSIKFFKENMIKIFVSLLFKINLQSKIIILRYCFNFFFIKKINLENQIILIAVEKKNRNLGVGSMLIKCLQKKIYKKIYVSSDLTNNKAHNFYLKNGFNYFKVMKLGLRKIKVFECKLS